MRRPAPIGGATPPEMSTGNEDDDELLKQIAARESLDKPRRWQHYLHVPTEQVAYGVAAPLDALGTARLPGTEYDGWQASMEWDEKLDGRDWPDSLE